MVVRCIAVNLEDDIDLRKVCVCLSFLIGHVRDALVNSVRMLSISSV